MNYQEKKEMLLQYLDKLASKDIAVAFSGGVDSSLLLYMATQASKLYRTTVYAVTLHTALHPTGDLEYAAEIAAQFGAQQIVIEVDELSLIHI